MKFSSCLQLLDLMPLMDEREATMHHPNKSSFHTGMNEADGAIMQYVWEMALKHERKGHEYPTFQALQRSC